MFDFYRGYLPGWVCRDAQTVDLDFRSTDRRGMDGRDPVRESWRHTTISRLPNVSPARLRNNGLGFVSGAVAFTALAGLVASRHPVGYLEVLSATARRVHLQDAG